MSELGRSAPRIRTVRSPEPEVLREEPILDAPLWEETTAAAPAGPYLVGSRQRWMRDWALIGASSALAPAVVLSVLVPGLLPALLLACLIGGVLGGAVGVVAPPLLERVRGRVPIPALLLLGLPLAAVWGWLGGFGAAIAMLLASDAAAGVHLLGTLMAVTSALQLGGAWFPYTFQSVLGQRTWPVVLAACCLAPLLGLLLLLRL